MPADLYMPSDPIFEGLHGKPGFQSLTDGELRLVASYAGWRSFAPNQIVFAPGMVPDVLYVTVDGGTSSPMALPSVFDAPALLFGRGVRHDVSAGPMGLRALAITRQHVFTIARECPEFVIDLLKMADVDRP